MKARPIAWPSAGTAVLETFELPEACPADCVLLESEFTLISPGTERSGFLNMPNTCGGAPMISEILTPRQAPEAYQALAKGGTHPPGVLFDWRNLSP